MRGFAGQRDAGREHGPVDEPISALIAEAAHGIGVVEVLLVIVETQPSFQPRVAVERVEQGEGQAGDLAHGHGVAVGGPAPQQGIVIIKVGIVIDPVLESVDGVLEPAGQVGVAEPVRPEFAHLVRHHRELVVAQDVGKADGRTSVDGAVGGNDGVDRRPGRDIQLAQARVLLDLVRFQFERQGGLELLQGLVVLGRGEDDRRLDRARGLAAEKLEGALVEGREKDGPRAHGQGRRGKVPRADVGVAADLAGVQREAVDVEGPAGVAGEEKGPTVTGEGGADDVAGAERKDRAGLEIGEGRQHQFVFLAGPHRIGQGPAVRGDAGRLFEELVIGQVADRRGFKVQGEDVMDAFFEGREKERPAVGQEAQAVRLILGHDDLLQRFAGQRGDDEQAVAAAVAGQEDDPVAVWGPGQGGAERGFDLVFDVFVVGGVALGDGLQDPAVPGGEQDDVHLAVPGVVRDGGHQLAARGQGMGEGEIIGVDGEFRAQGDAVVLGILPGIEILEAGPQVFLEFLAEFAGRLLKGPQDRIAAGQKGVG